MYPDTLNPIIASGMACDLKCSHQSGPQEFAGNVGTWTLLSLGNGTYFCCSHSGKLETARREEGVVSCGDKRMNLPRGNRAKKWISVV